MNTPSPQRPCTCDGTHAACFEIVVALVTAQLQSVSVECRHRVVVEAMRRTRPAEESK